VPRLGEHDVLRLEVAVDDATGVGLGEPLGDLDREVERPRRLQGRAAEEGGERPAPHQLHGDERRALVLVDLVDDRHRGVRDGGCGARLLLEPALLLGIAAGGRAQHLERDLAAERRVQGPVDDPRASPADLFEHPVVRQRPSDHRFPTRGHCRPDGPAPAGARRRFADSRLP
jgi:hypothetical protein